MEIEESIAKPHEYQDCYAIVSQKGKMISTSRTIIKIWNIQPNGTIKLQNKLNGHKSLVLCLYFCKYSDQFFSGGLEELLVWKKQDDWKCIQKESMNGIIEINMNSKETILFTSSLDCFIKIWKRTDVFKLWECTQILIQNYVQYQITTFNNLMASSHSQNVISIYRCKINYQKCQTIQTQHHGINFIDEDTLLCQVSYPGSLILFKFNKNCLFEKESEYQFTNSTTYNSYSPLIYNKIKSLLIVKNNQSLFIIKIIAMRFIVTQIINFNTPVIQTCLSDNYLIFWDDETKELQLKQL